MRQPARKLTDPVSIRFGREDRDLERMLRARAKATRRSLSDQVKHAAFLGMVAQDNPDLPMTMIEDILHAREELRAGLGQPYQFGVLEPDGR